MASCLNLAENSVIPYAAASSIPATGVLVLAPHPDDEVFGCGGSLALHVDQGVPVRVVVLTGGGTFGEPAERMEESRRAAGVLGYGEPLAWGMADRGLLYGEALVARILSAARESGADLIYAPSPLEIHPDHRHLALAAAETVRRQGPPARIAFYEIGVPVTPNLLVDITPVEGRKREAMACFASQLKMQRYDEHIAALNRFRTYTLPRSVTSAEAYCVLTAEELARGRLALMARPDAWAQRATGYPAMPEDVPLVSVLIRRQHGLDLGGTLASLANQTWPNLEIVLADQRPDLPQPMLPEEGAPIRRVTATTLAALSPHLAGKYCLILREGDAIQADHLARLVEGLEAAPLRRVAASAGMLGGAPLGMFLFARGEGDNAFADWPLDGPEDDAEFLNSLAQMDDLLVLSAASLLPELPGLPCDELSQQQQLVAGLLRRIYLETALPGMQKARAELVVLQESRLALMDQLKASRTEHDRLREDYEEMQRAFLRSEGGLEVERRRALSLEQDAQALERIRLDILSSFSWRITAPVRWLSQLLRGSSGR